MTRDQEGDGFGAPKNGDEPPRPEGDEGVATLAVGEPAARQDAVLRFELRVVEGTPNRLVWESTGDRCSIGSHASNDLVLDDPTVSRFHCEVWMDRRGAQVSDLGSRNGTILDGVMVKEAWLRQASLLRVGRTVLQFHSGSEHNPLPISDRTEFGSLVGVSVAMRATFAVLERAAATDSTVLLEGETGTGKEGAAVALHEAGARKQRPLVVVDCASMPPDLLESELFGHEKGAFTGAAFRRIGAFEEASSGTIFLDEVGELSLDLQPKLLRALEARRVRRIGSNSFIPIDVRLIAATNRDLRTAVNDGRFRPDLYYRLAVVRLRMPPLRERPEDIPILVERLLGVLGGAPAAAAAALLDPNFLATIKLAAWPGNVRQLRNYLERCLVFQQPLPVGEPETDAGGGASAPRPMNDADLGSSYYEARRLVLETWERHYVEALLRQHHGEVEPAARAAGIGRAYMYRLLSRHRLLNRHRPS